ncbi:hypothetical protein MXB_3335, partial [Myxobolus squamalis]
GSHVSYIMIRGGNATRRIILTNGTENKNAYARRMHSWSVYLLFCFSFPTEDSDSILNPGDNEGCQILKILKPNDKLLDPNPDYPSYIDASGNMPFDLHNAGIEESYLSDDIDDSSTGIQLNQGLVKTIFFMGKISNSADKGHPFMIPLNGYEKETLSVNRQYLGKLVSKGGTATAFGLKKLNISNLIGLIYDTDFNKPSDVGGRNILTLDVISFSKDGRNSPFMYHDMCIDTDIENVCSDWNNASYAYRTGTYVHRFRYNIHLISINEFEQCIL